MRRIIYILLCVLGLIGFLSLNVIVCLVTEQEFSGLKHVIMIIGYVSLIAFGIGFLMLMKKGEDDNVKK